MDVISINSLNSFRIAHNTVPKSMHENPLECNMDVHKNDADEELQRLEFKKRRTAILRDISRTIVDVNKIIQSENT